MDTYRMLVWVHIAFGSVALLSFWVAGLARKGSAVHKRSGKLYLQAMLGILVTALPIALVFIARGRIGIGVFFAYLVLITGSSMWLSWTAIRHKASRARYFDWRYRALAWLNIAAGLLVFALGVARGSMLLSTFCWVGVAIGASMLWKLRRPPTARNWWLREHYGAMLGNGVATHIAFLGVAMQGFLSSLQIPALQVLPWFAPLGVAALAGVYFNRRYAQG